MSSDELQRTHERIGELEALLAGREKRRPVSWVRVVLAALSAIGVVVAAAEVPLETRRVEVMHSIPTPEVIPTGALTIADNDALAITAIEWQSYVIVRAWRPGPDEVYVIAFDRETWKPAWRSKPFAARDLNRGHLAVTRGWVVFAGAKEAAVFDARTGAMTHFVTLERPARRLHVSGDSPDRVIIGSSPTHASSDDAIVFDVTNGSTRTESEGREPDCTPGRMKICLDNYQTPTPAVRRFYPAADATFLVHDGTDEFMLVHDRVGVGPGELEHVIVWDGGKAVWHAPLAPKSRTWTPWPNTVPEGKVAFAKQRIFYLYPLPDGKQRLRALSWTTGAELYDVEVADVGYGSTIGQFTADRDEVFLVANDALFVFDAAKGSLKKRLDVF